MTAATASRRQTFGGIERDALRQIDAALNSAHGVEAVRALVLDLAVRGRLLAGPNSPSPSPGAEPFPVPSSWRWARVEDLTVKLGAGSTPLGGKKVYKSTGIKFLRSQNVWNDGLRLDDVAFIEEKTHEEMSGTWVEAGDILLNITGASIGRSAVVPDGFDSANVSQHVAIVRLADKGSRRFVHLCIISPYFQRRVMDVQVGVSREGLSMKRLRDFVIPLPPPDEQKRIVAKVDQLMALCDELEAKQAKKRAVGDRLTKAALAALTSAETPEEFKVAWCRVSEHVGSLVDVPAAVAELRRALRVLAVSGRLAERVQGEGQGADAIPRLRADLAAAKRQWDEPDELAKSDAGYAAPQWWQWVRLRNLAVFGPTNGFSPKAVEFATATKSLTLTATTSGRFDGKFFKYLDEKIDRESSLWLRDGDLLIQRSNTIDYVGAAAIYRGAEREFIYPDLMMKVRLSDAVEVEWVHTVLWAAPTREYFRRRATGTAGSMPAEQRRILDRLRTLLSLCDKLEESLVARDARARMLAGALTALAVH